MMKTNGTNIFCRTLLLALALSVSACDGGIFGTGGSTDEGMFDPLDGETFDEVDNVISTDSDDVSSNGSDAGDTMNSSTDSPGIAGAPDNSLNEEGESTESIPANEAPSNSDNTFTNDQATLDSSERLLNLINTTSLTINAIETGSAITSPLFGDDGVATNSVSTNTTLQEPLSSLDVFLNSDLTQPVFSIPNLIADDATFTTLLARENNAVIDVLPLISLTTTTDSTLARVRIIQASAMGDSTATAIFALESAGANPGGMDLNFGPLSFDTPATEYAEITSGDYELIDPLGRIESQLVSFEGAMVYTVILLEGSAALIVNDTQAAN